MGVLCLSCVLLLVALRKESVDRNIDCNSNFTQKKVALRKESVDRNAKDWLNAGCLPLVALRKESVDRNLKRSKIMKNRRKSLSARRAWIEMLMVCQAKKYSGRRSPQGERG